LESWGHRTIKSALKSLAENLEEVIAKEEGRYDYDLKMVIK